MTTSDSTHDSVHLPDKPALEGLRDKWDAAWGESGVYAFDPDTTREDVYSIDTPPPPPPRARSTWDTCSPTRRPT